MLLAGELQEVETNAGQGKDHLYRMNKLGEVISPTACGAFFSARTTPQPSQNRVEPWWNPRGILVEPSWNLSSGSPQTNPEPIWAETPKLSAVGE